ncbi:glutamine amidotransferase [Arthrobacter sp. Leaf337]|uniref:gamma-glutamyl-gamma-aminobutyrate hydrolase family protein n=1 Tax=unclassified Arthrobacter TaxID=235627 RepID=UPI0006F58774|nr:type 1 glutamine amidotransferase [Arthrobacter sp. Leaf337]KQR82033.1 glutamine amidotransferase [Arthrobacter sp. Leaf337]
MRTPPPPPPGRPRIGIPVRLSSSRDADPRVGEANELFDYIVDLVRDGGGEPVLLTPDSDGGSDGGGLAETLKGLDGVVLPGGGDLDPRLYGEEPGAECYDVNVEQDALDVAVARGTIEAGLPLLGICRGHQLLNVLYGGTLVQDMADGPVTHHEPAAGGAAIGGGEGGAAGAWAWHDVDIIPGSKVGRLYASRGTAQGLTVRIASGHHQAVARVADGLIVTAVAGDGTVEALEDPARWVASVQWHPEVLELPAQERVAPFRAFVEACYYRQNGSMSYQENIG